MKELELNNSDPEDIEFLLAKVEGSFGIRFHGKELVHVNTFGEMCDHIKNKIVLDHEDNCTSQQAFYKLRGALMTALQIDKETVTPDTLLKDLLPKPIRRSKTKQIEKNLGFKLSLLRPPHFIMQYLGLLFIGSLIGLGFSWQYALVGLGLSIAGFWLAVKMGNELDLRTVRELVEKMSREHYLKSRRNPKTYNKNEIEKVLIEWFSYDLVIDKSKLTRDASLT